MRDNRRESKFTEGRSAENQPEVQGNSEAADRGFDFNSKSKATIKTGSGSWNIEAEIAKFRALDYWFRVISLMWTSSRLLILCLEVRLLLGRWIRLWAVPCLCHLLGALLMWIFLWLPKFKRIMFPVLRFF
ncbi:hypothetical protein LWI29_028084 [Acer saccharum]|uniref:Uncharacterized protein n=1 Tax=Acer saccharum TaxID=4024 RepID=A0AA39S5C1_ACESA|nr:hypothetical protein LWI29_028084 [Acer saccharum]